MNNYLTPERVKSMPISMQIIKAIKEKYGIPTRAFAKTRHGLECSVIYVEGINCNQIDLFNLVTKFKTKEMQEDDWEAEYDTCSVICVNPKDYPNVNVFITSLFEEV